MKTTPTIAFCALLLFTALPAYSQPAEAPFSNLSAEEITDVMSNVQQDYTDCAVYYTLSKEALERGGRSIEQTQVEQAIEHAEIMLYSIGEMAGISEEAILARWRVSFKSMMRRIDNNYMNFSILIDEHSDTCKTIVEGDIEDRVTYWAERLNYN
jgi:hypothetical protein